MDCNDPHLVFAEHDADRHATRRADRRPVVGRLGGRLVVVVAIVHLSGV
jgi:hypothetical protein